MSNGKKTAMEKRGEKKADVSRDVFPFPRSFEEMERFFEHFHPRGWLRPFHWEPFEWPELPMLREGRLPKMDVVDQGDTLLVKAELPGVEKDDIEISLDDSLLTISAQTKKETTRKEKGKFQRREIYQGSFCRSITLPVNVDAGKASAKFKDGVLELTFPKKEAAKRRTIKVEG